MATRNFAAIFTTCIPTILLAVPLFSLPLAAATSSKKEKWYQVEVIIFQQQDHYQQEQPRRDIQLSYPANYLELIDPTLPTAEEISDSELGNKVPPTIITSKAESERNQEQEQPFIMLDKSQRQMNTEATTLRRRSGYQLLFHQAWRQPGIGSNRAPWILVRAGDSYDSHFELEGSLRLILTNYLHLETDMWLSSFTKNVGQENEAWPQLPNYPIAEVAVVTEENIEQQIKENEPNHSFDNSNLESRSDSDLGSENKLSWPFPGTDAELESAYLVTSIDRFNANLKLKLNSIHYLDHPRMGVLVRVSRYKLPEPEPTPEPKPEPQLQPLAPTSLPVGGQVQ